MSRRPNWEFCKCSGITALERYVKWPPFSMLQIRMCITRPSKNFSSGSTPKGYVRREPKGIAYLYAATVGRDELVGQRLRVLSESLCDGSVTPLLTQLAQHERLNKKQQAALMALIDELDGDEDKGRKPRGRRK